MNASRNRKLGVLAVVIVALAAGGAALAASKLHNSGTTSGMRGGPPGFSGGSGSGSFGAPPTGYFGRPGNGGGGFRGRDFDGLSAATSYLGVSPSQLRSQLASGKTLAQIANATSGKSAAGLIDAMVAAQRKQLDQAVWSGRISQSTADQIESNLKSRVTDLVNGTFHRFDGDGDGHGPPQGFGQQLAPTNTTPSTHI
jgi:hypothetical protein